MSLADELLADLEEPDDDSNDMGALMPQVEEETKPPAEDGKYRMYPFCSVKFALLDDKIHESIFI